jgi:hypothetical protein
VKKLLLFVVCYFVITMAWAYPWHLIWYHEKYVAWGAVTRQEPIMLLGISAIFIQGTVIGYLYPFFKNENSNSIINGIKFNLIIGLMTYTAMGFATAAKIQIEPVSAFLTYHSIFQLVQFTLTGIALGWIYQTEKN